MTEEQQKKESNAIIIKEKKVETLGEVKEDRRDRRHE